MAWEQMPPGTIAQDSNNRFVTDAEKILWGSKYGSATDIVQDATHRFVSDTEKNTWNSAQSYIPYQDTRSTNFDGLTYPGVTFHLKSNATDGLNDGGSFHGVLNLGQWTDYSTSVHQLGFTDNGNMWIRTGTAINTWTAWKKVTAV